MHKFSEQYFNEDPDKNTIHENWNRLKSKIHDLREQFVPSKMSSTRNNLPYITRAIQRMIKKKQRQYNKAKNTQAQKDWSAFRNIRSKLKFRSYFEKQDQISSIINFKRVLDPCRKPSLIWGNTEEVHTPP